MKCVNEKNSNQEERWISIIYQFFLLNWPIDFQFVIKFRREDLLCYFCMAVALLRLVHTVAAILVLLLLSLPVDIMVTSRGVRGFMLPRELYQRACIVNVLLPLEPYRKHNCNLSSCV